MKRSFNQIIDIDSAGKLQNTIPPAELFADAFREEPGAAEASKTLLLAVDVQNDFMDGGALGVSGASNDVLRLTRFIYDNFYKIDKIAVTLDTHEPRQIFHPCWWRDEAGCEPAPFTIITAEDVASGKWTPAFEMEESLRYVAQLEREGRRQLCIWPYHCLSGTSGCALEGQFAKMLHYHSIARRSPVMKIVKGTLPATEFYGVVRPEYSPDGVYTNRELLNDIMRYDRLIVAGEAMDYCVYESLRQLFEELDGGRTPEVFVLSDCMSSIQPRGDADALYSGLASRYSFRMVTSADNFL